MKKIILIHNILWSHYKASVFSELEKLAPEYGFQVHVLQTALTGDGQKALSNVDRSIHNYSYDLLFDSSFNETTFLGRFYKYLECVKESKPDALVLYGYSDPAIWLLTIYLLLSKVSIIQTCDSTYYDHKRIWLKEYVKKKLLGFSNLVFCYGRYQVDYLLSLNVPRDKIHIRVQATNNFRIKTEHDKLQGLGLKRSYSRPNFLFVGRLSREKNIESLLLAFSRLSTDCSLTIVGEGEERGRLEQISKDLKLQGKVFFKGSTDWIGVVEHYAKANVFVLPSKSEPWGLVVNEAMLCGLPIIISNHCGSAGDLVEEGKNGFTFAPESIDELEACLRYFINNPSSYSIMGIRSLAIIKKFTPERSAIQMLLGFQKIFSLK